MTLTFANRAALNVQSLRQIFTGAGAVAGMRRVFSEWFGVLRSSTAAGDIRTAAWQAAVNACNTNAVIQLSEGYYPFDGAGPLLLSKGQLIEGAGLFVSNIRFISDATGFAIWTTEGGGGAKGFRVDAAANTPTSGTAFVFSGANSRRGKLSDLFINQVWNAIEFSGAGGGSGNEYNIGDNDDVKVFGIYIRGLMLDWTENVSVKRLFMNAGAGGAPDAMIRIQNRAQQVNMFDVNCSCGVEPSLMVTKPVVGQSRGKDGRWCTVESCSFDGANIGLDINNSEMWRFVNCWFPSNGRTFEGKAGGAFIHVRSGAKMIEFIGGVMSNNGQQGIRLDLGAKDIFRYYVQIAANSVNGLGLFWNADIFGGVTIDLIGTLRPDLIQLLVSHLRSVLPSFFMRRSYD